MNALNIVAETAIREIFRGPIVKVLVEDLSTFALALRTDLIGRSQRQQRRSSRIAINSVDHRIGHFISKSRGARAIEQRELDRKEYLGTR